MSLIISSGPPRLILNFETLSYVGPCSPGRNGENGDGAGGVLTLCSAGCRVG